MGAIQGLFLAQYKVLRKNGHTPSEAFNETVEEATQSLYPLIGQYGMDYMYNACSTTARRGALDWAKVFEETNLPVFERLYQSVRDGSETRRSLEFNGRSTYREDLAKELKEIDEQEIWRAGAFALFPVCRLIIRRSHACITRIDTDAVRHVLQARLSARSAPTASLEGLGCGDGMLAGWVYAKALARCTPVGRMGSCLYGFDIDHALDDLPLAARARGG